MSIEMLDFEVLTVVLLKTQVFWDILVRCLVNSS
jgi:hypothetical protein